MKTPSTPSSTTSSDTLLARSPDGLDTVQWRAHDGRVRTAHATPALSHEDFTRVPPMRQGVQYQNRLNRHALHYFAPQGTHVWCESALEAECLLELEHTGDVRLIASQPMLMLFAAGSKVLKHYPDFFAVHANGDRVVYDVKPSGRMTDAVRDQFEETARLCNSVGWRHTVVHEGHPVKAKNLQALRAARHHRYHPTPDVYEHIQSVFDSGRTAQEGARMVNLRSPHIAFAHIRHLLWHRIVETDLTTAVGAESVLRTTTKGTPCCAV